MLVSLVLTALLTTAPAPAGAPQPVRMRLAPPRIALAGDSVSVPMRTAGGHVFVDVTLRGRGPYAFYLDTGAAGTVMDLALARELGVPLGPEVLVGSPGGGGRPGHVVTLDSLALGGLGLDGLHTVVVDSVPASPGLVPAPRGVLGPYMLAGLLVTLDFPAGRIVFRRGALPGPDGREIFAWDRNGPLPRLSVTVAGRPCLVHLDSGAPGGLGLPAALADSLALAGPIVDAGRARVVDHEVTMRAATLRGDLVIGRYRLQAPRVTFTDGLGDTGRLGEAILRQFVITLDPANARVRLSGPADGRLAGGDR